MVYRNFLSFSFVLFAFLHSIAQEVAEWSPAQINAKIKDNKSVTILDVRTPAEYAEGHLANAVLIDFYSPGFEQKVLTLDKKKTVYVYCLAGVRSKKAAIFLKQKGYQVISMSGGIKSWSESGLPVTKGR